MFRLLLFTYSLFLVNVILFCIVVLMYFTIRGLRHSIDEWKLDKPSSGQNISDRAPDADSDVNKNDQD